MNYKYTLIIEETEFDEEVFKMDCGTAEGVEALLRKAEHAIKKYEGQKEAEADYAQELWKETHDQEGNLVEN